MFERVRERDVEAGDAQDRRFEMFDGLIGDDGRNFGADAARLRDGDLEGTLAERPRADPNRAVPKRVCA